MDAPPSKGSTILGWGMLALLLWLGTSGIISSNDGSHIALARALTIRSQTRIDPEVALTLWVDRAKRDGHQYSDRPPGTAFAAAPAIRLGSSLDAGFLARSLASGEVVFTPAAPAYVHVYATRPKTVGVRATPILAYQGTALALSLHTVFVGLLGLWAVARLLRNHGIGPGGRAFAVGGLGLCTLWGPYATTLFSHGTAGTMLALMLLALDEATRTELPRRRATLAAAAGLAAGWSCSADYLVGLLALGVAVASLDIRRDRALLLWMIAGAGPIVVATALYHHAAFGSPFSIGYDHHANFEFARDRTSTFSGNPFTGLWTLWGWGQGAGVLALAPLAAFGIVGLARSPWRRAALGAVPWALVLAFHKTPAGGGSEDHRYLVPLLPVLGLGLGALWQRLATDRQPRGRALQVALVLVACTSAYLSWSHFLRIRG